MLSHEAGVHLVTRVELSQGVRHRHGEWYTNLSSASCRWHSVKRWRLT
jgi:hypothetical protein